MTESKEHGIHGSYSYSFTEKQIMANAVHLLPAITQYLTPYARAIAYYAFKQPNPNFTNEEMVTFINDIDRDKIDKTTFREREYIKSKRDDHIMYMFQWLRYNYEIFINIRYIPNMSFAILHYILIYGRNYDYCKVYSNNTIGNYTSKTISKYNVKYTVHTGDNSDIFKNTRLIKIVPLNMRCLTCATTASYSCNLFIQREYMHPTTNIPCTMVEKVLFTKCNNCLTSSRFNFNNVV